MPKAPAHSRVTSDFRDALDRACVDAVRAFVAGHPLMTTADLRALLGEAPQLGELTLDQLFGGPDPEPIPTPPKPKKRRRRRTRKPYAKARVRQPFVGKRLRELRKQAGLTRAVLTQEVSMKASALVRLEAGDNVRLSTYFPVVEYFVVQDPQTWMIAERAVLLSPEARTELIALLDALESERERGR